MLNRYKTDGIYGTYEFELSDISLQLIRSIFGLIDKVPNLEKYKHPCVEAYGIFATHDQNQMDNATWATQYLQNLWQKTLGVPMSWDDLRHSIIT